MKKTWKRWSALLLAVVMTLSLFPTAALAARVNDDEVAIDAPDAGNAAAQTAELPGGAEDGPAQLAATGDFTTSEADGDPLVTDPTDDTEDITLDNTCLSFYSSRYSDAAAKVLDGNTGTAWEATWTTGGTNSGQPNPEVQNTYIQIALPEAKTIQGLRYYTKTNGAFLGWKVMVSTSDKAANELTIDDFTLAGESTDTTKWTKDLSWKLAWVTPVEAKYIRLYSKSVWHEDNNGNQSEKSGSDQVDCISCAELRLIGYRGNPIVTNRSFTVTVSDGSTPDTKLAATVAINGTEVIADGTTGVATFTGMSNIPYTATVSMNGYKTRTVEVSADAANVDVALWQPVASNADVTAHKWDYPLWATADQDASNHTVNGGEANAYSWANNGSGDDPWWAAIDGVGEGLGAMWHANYGGGGGQAAASDNVGMWYEFTLGQKTNIIGVWVHTRDNANSNLTSVAVRVNGTDETLTSAQWAALPAKVTTTSFTNNSWQFIELPEAVEAKQVRIYGIGASYFVAKELRVVMDPETSGAKQLTGTVQTSADGNAAIPGATLTVANHSATSDSNGAFDLGYLPAGQYDVTASAPYYATKTQTVTIPTDGNLSALEFSLDPQNPELTVTVANNIAGATVTLANNNNDALPVSGVAAATTNESGVATLNIGAANSGTYKLRVSHPDYDVSTTTVTIPSNKVASANVTLTARTKADHDLVKTYDFSSADQVNDFQPIVSGNGATVEYDSEKQAMKITFVGDETSYKNLVINKKFAMDKGWVEFDVTPEGTVGAEAAIGAAVHYSNGAWLHVGQLKAVNTYAMSTHASPTEVTEHGSGSAGYVAMGNGATRRIALQVLNTTSSSQGTHRTQLMVDDILGNWKANHNIPNDTGLWGFNAKNANGLVVYIDNVKLYRPTADKSAVTINDLAEDDGTLSTKIVTELDATGTDLTSGDTAYAGDTVKISAAGIPENKVFAVTVTKTGDTNTVVTTTKESDGSFTFTMPAYPVTITPAAATGLTDSDVTVTGTTAGSGNQIDGNPFPTKYVRVGQTLTVTPATGVTYQWQYSTDGSTWNNITGNATAASFQLTAAQYNSEATVNKVRVVVTGDNTAYAGTITSEAVDVLAALQEVTGVTFERNTIEMWSNVENDPNTGNTAIEGKTTTAKAFIAPTNVTRPMTVEWESSNTEVVSISNPDDHATLEGSGDEARLVVTATLTALKPGTATIKCYATAKDGTTRVECLSGITVTVKAETKSVKVYKAEGNMGTTASTTEVTVDAPLVIYTNSDADLATLNAQEGATQRYNKFRLFATPTPTEVSDVADWQWVRQDQSLTGLIRAENTDGNNATRLVYAQGSAEAGYTEQNVGERTVLVKKTGDAGPTYATFRVVVLRHLVHDVTVGYTGGATEARPGVTLEAVTSALNISDAGVTGLTYEWYRKAAATESTPNPTAVKIADQSGKTYTLTDADIGCQITVKVIAAPEYSNGAENKYYYEGTRTSTNSITVGKNAAPDAPELSSTPYSNNAGTETKGTIVITSPVAGETYEIRHKTSDAGVTPETWSDWADATLTSGNTIADRDAGDYQVRIKENNLHDAGTAKAVTVQDSSKTYHAVTVTVKTQDFQGNDSTLTGGTVLRGSDNVEAGQSATLTVTPNAGFEILSVTNDSDPLTGTDGENGVKTYTVSDVAAPVAFAVTFKQKSVTITHNFTNLKCSLANLSNNSHTVAYGSVTEITVSLADGVSSDAYELPERGASTIIKDSDSQPFTNYNYDQATGKITITGGLTESITITASAKPKSYAVSFTNMSNVSGPSGTQTATYGTDYEAQLTAVSGYSLPTEVTVKRGDTTLTLNTDYTYANGKVTVKGAAITGNITISATGVKNTTPLTAVTITLPQGATAPTVGDTLRAAVTPDGASATYKWYVGGSEVSNLADTSHQSYTVRADDVGKKIKVEATGTGDYSGTVPSAETAAVLARTYPVTGVTLNKTTTSIVFGATDTLTATVAPENATDKSVTWGTSNANVATVADGVVTATGVGEATITARTANGREATCTVTVTAKDLTNDESATVRVGGTLELGQTVTANLVPTDAATGARYAWYIVDANDDTVYTFTDNSKSVELPNDSSYLGAKVKVVVTYGGNYTGTKTRITDGVIAGEVPSHSVVIATGIQNGTVTADKTTAKEGETVTLTIAPTTGYELDALTVTGYHNEAVQITKENDTTYTFTMPRNLQTGDVVNVTATFRVATVTPTTYAITTAVEPANSGRVQVTVEGTEVTSAEAGKTVYVAANPNGDYVLSTITAKDADDQAVTVTNEGSNYYFTMPAKAVTVTATFVTDSEPEVNKAALAAAIEAANAAMKDVVVSDKDVDAVEKDVEYYPQSAVDALTQAVKTAEAVLNKANATQDEVDEAVTALTDATATFTAAKKTGTMDDAELVAAIEAARTAKAAVYTINDEPANVKEGIQFVTTDEMKALNDAIDTAQEALNDPDKTQTTLNEAKDALAAAKVIFDDAIKTGTSKTAEAPVVDTTALDEAIAAAEAAKKNVVIKDADTDPATVSRGTKFVTQEVMDALDAAIAAAEGAKADENKTDGSVSNAVDALYAAVEDFNAAIQTGTKSTGSTSSNRPSNSTTTETKEDGTKVTTETKSDGTTIVTTETPDGAKEVVETKKDGTVTETKTDAEGAKTEKVTTPEKDVTITVTDKDGEELAKVELPAEIPALETRFEDVPEGHWADKAIHHAASLKLVEGVGDNKFDMVSDMTRGALAAVLYRLSQGKTDYETTFKDVAEGQYYTEGVAWAAKVNVVTGYTEDTFAPEDTITREQLAVMLCRYAKLVGMDTTADAKALDKFADGENTGAWAVDGMAWCVANGILQGKGGSVLDPTASVSRAEVATMLDRFIALMK